MTTALQHKYPAVLALMLIFLIPMPQVSADEIKWHGVQQEEINGATVKTLGFDGAGHADRWGLLPVFVRQFDLPAPGLSLDFEIANTEFLPLTVNDDIEDINLIPEKLSWDKEIITIRGKSKLVFRLLPLRKNPETGNYEKLVSFEMSRQPVPGAIMKAGNPTDQFAESSVLATGDWYKISVEETGIYKMTREDMNELGMNAGEIPSEMIRLYGNGGGMLPQRTSDPRDDDLIENAIMMEDGGDGTFDEGDYFIFYGESPHQWELDIADGLFEHTTNLYTQRNFYFITIGTEPGKRVQNLEQSTVPAELIFTTYNDYAVHEKNEKSLIKSGAEWYGEDFVETVERDFVFPFPNRDVTREVHIAGDFAARSTTVCSFTAFINQDSVFTDNVSAIPENSITKYANPSSKSSWFMANDEQDITVTLRLNRKDEKPIGWLNYLQLNVMSHLQFNGHQFGFRNINAYADGQVSEFHINGTDENFRIWDVTDPHSARQIMVTHEDDQTKFALLMEELMEFVGFDGTDYMTPGLEGYVENQNLHAYQTAEFIIITHPEFDDQAQRLKALHEEIDGMDVIVADLYDIYNEFSSGAADVTAIRDFVRMVYLRSGTPPKLKYVLLFGDGSYDPLDRIGDNLSFIPTFQSRQSLWYTSTYVTDDYFGLMDPEEGNDASGNVDLGIGRFAVNSHEGAKLMVDKVEKYMRMTPEVQGNWRNSLTFVADDEDNNLHLYQADTILVSRIQRRNQSVNINKIYLDSYRQESSASGHTYPGVNADISKQVNNGTLIVNYTGHGGELGLAHEKVVQISDILSWHNSDKMPVFVTATCEFSRFDNPGLTSAGELVLMNPNGGGIALYTTTRLAFASSNLLLNKRLYDTLFRAYPERHPRLGDLMMFSKTPSNTNIRNFVLLGNPALKLALPGYKVVTDSVNGIPVEQFSDTLNANSTLTISGHIGSYQTEGQLIEDFNGTIYPILYDKPTTVTTLGNDPKSYPFPYEAQNSILFKGKATVKNGRFTFSLVLPTDISYQFGHGKLSYYAADSLRDAGGYFSGMVIGGINQDASADVTGPEINMYLNEFGSFQPNLINPNPVLFAALSDPSGINANGTGIGHDITLTVNGDSYNSIVLNSRFEPAIDDHTSGTIVFPFNSLPNGDYTLELKAWDMFNNSSVGLMNFTVSDSIQIGLTEVYNYPNPFKDHTWFTFNHNQFEGDLTFEINIYNFYGQHVRTIGPEKVFTSGYSIEPVYWGGDSEGGARLQPGIYFYTIRVTNDKGHSTDRVQKMILTR